MSDQPKLDLNQVLNQLVINVKAGGTDADLARSLAEQGVPAERAPSMIAMARKRAGMAAPAAAPSALAAIPAPSAPLAAEAAPVPPADPFGAPAEAAPAQAASDAPVKVTFTGPPLSPAMAFLRGGIGGGAAAIIGGVIWGMLVVWTEREFGLVAWGIGIIAGIGVLIGTRGAKGLVYQLEAVIASIAGIGIGKYVAFAHIFCAMVAKGEVEGVTQASTFSGMTILAFVFTLPSLLNGYDLLWVGFAVYTSWRMLSNKPAAVKK